MERDATDQLDVVMALAERANGRLANGGKGLGQELVELLPVLEPLAKTPGLAAQLIIRKRGNVGLEAVDRVDILAKTADIAVVGRSEDALCHCGEHGIPLKTRALQKGQEAPADALGNCVRRCKERPSRSQLTGADMGLTGGCMCGAVRYELTSDPFDCGWCHCRTCQLNSGSPAMVFASVPERDLVWTAGADKVKSVASSSFGHREFCGE